jgi:hypothetical protein
MGMFNISVFNKMVKVEPVDTMAGLPKVEWE